MKLYHKQGTGGTTQLNMNRIYYHKTRSAGCLKIIISIIDSDTRTNALPASTGPRSKSINTNEFLGLEQTWGPMPQHITTRASSELVYVNPTGKRV